MPTKKQVRGRRREHEFLGECGKCKHTRLLSVRRRTETHGYQCRVCYYFTLFPVDDFAAALAPLLEQHRAGLWRPRDGKHEKEGRSQDKEGTYPEAHSPQTLTA